MLFVSARLLIITSILHIIPDSAAESVANFDVKPGGQKPGQKPSPKPARNSFDGRVVAEVPPIFLLLYVHARRCMLCLTHHPDQLVAKANPNEAKQVFDEIDADKDGSISKDESNNHIKQHNPEILKDPKEGKPGGPKGKPGEKGKLPGEGKSKGKKPPGAISIRKVDMAKAGMEIQDLNPDPTDRPEPKGRKEEMEWRQPEGRVDIFLHANKLFSKS
ncbi:unnamed protein product [Sphagnum tenellum]